MLGTGDGDALAAMLGTGDGDALAAMLGTGDGVGRNPTGSGPTNRNAASTPRATRTPARRPARITAADRMRRESTSTDSPKSSLRRRC
jgi:hypothetical protein